MNYINAKITSIQSVDTINIVTFENEDEVLKMMSLELDDSLQTGSRVVLGAKATNIALARNRSVLLSISNQLECRIEKITYGELLCSVKLRFAQDVLESITTRESVSRMNLQVGEDVIALIKASDLSIVKVA